jgi:hypothetical protein
VADLPAPQLEWTGGCPDCAQRTTDLPDPLPAVGDDFDWQVRDFDGFRTFMLQELMAHYPQRARWTEADVEVVIVEALAAVLDQLSDMLDRVSTESYLETARRPESVRRLLLFIGYDAVAESGLSIPDGVDPGLALEQSWRNDPTQMELARRAGPLAVQQPNRMVTAADYGSEVASHPLILRATAWVQWTGSWATMQIAVICLPGLQLDAPAVPNDPVLVGKLNTFNARHSLPRVTLTPTSTVRGVLAPFLDAYRMAGQEVVLRDAGVVPITMSISVQVNPDYFQSEVRGAIGTSLTQFFRRGNLDFGQSLHESDILRLLTAVPGVDDACLNRLKRLGSQFPDDTASGIIAVGPTEIIACDNDPSHRENGYYQLILHGGQRG